MGFAAAKIRQKCETCKLLARFQQGDHLRGGALGGAESGETLADEGVAAELRGAGGAVEESVEVAGDVGGVHVGGNELGDSLGVGDEVDERDPAALEEVRLGPEGEASARHLVAHHLRDVEDGGFEGCRAAGDEGCAGRAENVVGAASDNSGGAPERRRRRRRCRERRRW